MDLKQIYQPIAKELSQVEAELKKQINQINKTQKFVGEIINYFFNVPGKCLRPALVLLSAKSVNCQLSTVNYKLIHLAATIELIHNATLIHDDIIDNALYRRGQLSLNKQFSSQLAVLAGDILYSRAFSLLNDKFDKKIIGILSRCIEEMCYGEIKELAPHFCKSKELSLEEYLEIIKNKTASFMSVCCHASTVLNGADEKLSNALTDYGLNFGMAYQIMDDYVDKDVIKIEYPTFSLAEEYVFKAKSSIKSLSDSIYKRGLLDLADYIIRKPLSAEVVQCEARKIVLKT